jgi:hypothetical protein
LIGEEGRREGGREGGKEDEKKKKEEMDHKDILKGEGGKQKTTNQRMREELERGEEMQAVHGAYTKTCQLRHLPPHRLG